MRKFRIDSPSRYRISIQGVLSAEWSDRLGGLRIVTFESEDSDPVTVLSGDVIDQAALLGVLNALYDLRYPLLSVQRLEGDTPGDADACKDR